MDDSTLRQAKILIVDDETSQSDIIIDVLNLDGYTNIRSLADPRSVLAILLEWQPDLIILDLRMPYVDGFQVLNLIASLKAEHEYLPILINSADDTPENRHRALSHGAIDFLRKPFVADELCLRITNLLRIRLQQIALQEQNRDLVEVIQDRVQELEAYQLALKEAHLETINRLVRAAEHHDTETGQHTQRVAIHCSLLAQGLRLSEDRINLLQSAAALHDVGKIGIPDSVLLKPGRFTEAEYKIMRRHTLLGADLLSGGHSDLLRVAERIALTHHEKWDGSGYPRGLQRDGIDIFGRIVALADVFDALTHERLYKPAWSLDEAIQEIKAQSGKHFDPAVVEVFLSLPHHELL